MPMPRAILANANGPMHLARPARQVDGELCVVTGKATRRGKNCTCPRAGGAATILEEKGRRLLAAKKIGLKKSLFFPAVFSTHSVYKGGAPNRAR